MLKFLEYEKFYIHTKIPRKEFPEYKTSNVSEASPDMKFIN